MKYILFTLISVVLINCSSKTKLTEIKNETIVKEKDSIIEIKSVLIGKGSFGIIKGIEESNHVIRDKKTWNILLKKINKGHRKRIKNTEIDFNKYIVIAIFDKKSSYYGDTIKIINIIEHDKYIVINYKKPQKGKLPTGSQPYHIAKILNSTKQIKFKNINTLGNNQ